MTQPSTQRNLQKLQTTQAKKQHKGQFETLPPRQARKLHITQPR